jgi:hypothetical protein
MKPIITIHETAIAAKKEDLKVLLQNFVTEKQLKGSIELKPKYRKITEVIRILREHGIGYQIRFDASK